MSYPTIGEHRFPYDIDGTGVGWRGGCDYQWPLTDFARMGVQKWLTSTECGNLNKEDKSLSWRVSDGWAMWFFFPELREVSKIAFLQDSLVAFTDHMIQGSDDSTNGMDGTWETAVYTIQGPFIGMDTWRSNIIELSFSKPIKVLRVGLRCYYIYEMGICGIHVYGSVSAAAGIPNDITFTDADGVEMPGLMEFGDRPEGTTEIRSFRIKNKSLVSAATNVNIQLNHTDFSISTSSDGPWTSVIDFPSISPQSVSNLIYVKNLLGPPLILLGPRSARAIVSVGSWV